MGLVGSGSVGRVGVRLPVFGAAAVPSALPQKSYPGTDANSFWIMSPSGSGTAMGRKIVRNVNGGGGWGATDLGGSDPAWRLSVVQEFSSINENPNVTAPLGTWANDTGAQDAVLSAGGKFGNSYHGIGAGGSLSLNEVRADGNVVDPTTQSFTATQFSVRYTATVVFGTGETASVDFTLTVNNDGSHGKIATINSNSTFAQYYGNMNIASGAFDECYAGNTLASLVGFKHDFNEIYGPGLSNIRLRNSATGYTVTETSDAPSKAGFSRIEVRPAAAIGTRLKGYYRSTGVPGAVTFNSSTQYGKTAPGATAFGANLITNPSFATDVTTGWTLTTGGAGSTTWDNGTARQSSQTGSQNKLTQLTAGLDTAALYLFGYSVAISGSAPSVGETIGALGINTNGSTNTPAASPPIQAAGRIGQIFVPSQAQLQTILGTQATASAAGKTVANWDNIILTKLQ